MFTRGVMLLALAAGSAAAQATKAELWGTVRDPSGAIVEGARVEAAQVATGAAAETASGADGVWRFLALTPGVYRLTAAKPGFAGVRREGIALRVGDRKEVEIELALGDAAQAVEVRAAAPLLETGRGSVGQVVEQRKVAALPLDGRNFVPLIALSPGVSLPPGNVLPRINGSRPRVSEYIYDGISVLQPEPGQVAYYPVIDAMEEFRVETNSYSAEYGRSNGGVIMVNQKSGTNEVHGALFEFFRNERLNARNYFAPAGAAPRFRRNQYGFVLGGPVRRNRTFFFGDWQATRLVTGVVRTSTLPTTAQQRGVFAAAVYDPAATRQGTGRDPFPGNTVPVSRFDAAAARLAGRYPAPNVFTAGGAEAAANNYRRVVDDQTLAHQFDGRVDHHFNAAHRAFARYSFLRDDGRPATPLEDGSGNLASGLIGDTLTRADSVAAEHTWAVSARAVNQLRFGFTRRRFSRNALDTGRSAAAATGIPNLPLSSFSTVLPTFDIPGLQQLGPPASANSRFATAVTQWLDNYSTVHGRHSVKAGADVRLESLDVLQPASPTGNFQFTNIFTAALTPEGAVAAGTGHSYASFLLGQVGRFSLDAQVETLKPRARIAEFFAQDDYRATPKLTLNAGVRYTLNFPSTVVGDRGAVFNLLTQQLEFLGSGARGRSARDLEKTNFGPRVGLAYRMGAQAVVRAGYGMTWIEQAGITTPFTTPLFPFIQTLGQQALDNVNAAFVLSNGPTVKARAPGADSGLGQGVFGVQRDNGSGYAQQWNVMLQRTFASNWSVEAGYLGSKLTRLGVPDVNLNQLTVEQLGQGARLLEQVENPYYGQIPAATALGARSIARAQLPRPYPRFTTVALYRNNTGHSTYHALQARAERRYAGGLAFTAAYTYSRLIDDAGAVFDSAVLTGPVASFQAADSYNKRLEKDVSTGNIPHIVTSGFVYEAPAGRGRGWLLRGWQAAGTVRLQAGSPVAVTQATNLNAFAGFGIQRPNRVADPRLAAEERTTARWFNTAAFRAAPQFTLGSSSRNPVVGPGYAAVDVMVGRTFAAGERARVELRAEAFNATNTPALGNPNGSFGSAAFGSITTALDPRVFELVMKVKF